jgi:hypothetical protein
MIVRPRPGAAPAETAEEALWATLSRRLVAQGLGDAVPQLRHLFTARIEEEVGEGALTRIRFGVHQHASRYTARYNARTGELMGWFFHALMQRCESGHDEQACLAAASAVAAPPPDAELEMSAIEQHGEDTVFIGRWRHVHSRIPVEGDYIQVLVNPRTGRPFAFFRKWHAVDRRATAR